MNKLKTAIAAAFSGFLQWQFSISVLYELLADPAILWYSPIQEAEVWRSHILKAGILSTKKVMT